MNKVSQNKLKKPSKIAINLLRAALDYVSDGACLAAADRPFQIFIPLKRFISIRFAHYLFSNVVKGHFECFIELAKGNGSCI